MSLGHISKQRPICSHARGKARVGRREACHASGNFICCSWEVWLARSWPQSRRAGIRRAKPQVYIIHRLRHTSNDSTLQLERLCCTHRVAALVVCASSDMQHYCVSYLGCNCQRAMCDQGALMRLGLAAETARGMLLKVRQSSHRSENRGRLASRAFCDACEIRTPIISRRRHRGRVGTGLLRLFDSNTK